MDYTRNEDKWCSNYDYRIKDNYILSVTDISDPEAAEPVTLAEIKDHLQVDYTDKDAKLTEFGITARIQVEKEVNLSLKRKVLIAKVRNELGNIVLPYGPVNSITELRDIDDVVIDAGNYTIRNGILETPFSTAVNVVYDAGYNAGECPEDYKQMILERVAFLDKNRGDEKKTNNNRVWL